MTDDPYHPMGSKLIAERVVAWSQCRFHVEEKIVPPGSRWPSFCRNSVSNERKKYWNIMQFMCEMLLHYKKLWMFLTLFRASQSIILQKHSDSTTYHPLNPILGHQYKKLLGLTWTYFIHSVQSLPSIHRRAHIYTLCNDVSVENTMENKYYHRLNHAEC